MEFKYPPIVEANIEIRTETPISDEMLEKISKRFNNKGYLQSRTFNANVNLEFDQAGVNHSVSRTPFGYKLENWEDSVVLHLLPSIFVYTQLAPYTDWKNFSNGFNNFLKEINRIKATPRFERVGVRYVNRIDIPAASVEILDPTEYIKMGVNADIDTPSLGFDSILRLQVADNLEVRLRTFTADAIPRYASIVLDIDVYTPLGIQVKTTELATLLDEMRTHKNNFFSALITEKAKMIFDTVPQNV